MLSFVLRSARYYWRSHLGLLLGVFLAGAMLTGSLLVGDSVSASLQRLAALRLGKVSSGVVGGDRWFTAALAERVKGVPVVIASGSVSASAGGTRVNAAQVLGVNDAFWSLSPSGKVFPIAAGEVMINDSMARKLGAKVGDSVVVRMEKPSAISRDAPLSGSADQDVALRRKVAAIIGADDFGAFQLAASQITPDSVFVGLSDLQFQIEREGRVNVLLSATADLKTDNLAKAMTLDDYGVKLERTNNGKAEWQAGTDRVFMDDALANKWFQAMPGSYGVLTYLVNGITSGKAGTPYSMVTALPTGAAVPNGPRGITITQWLAEDQNLKPGDSVELRYFVVGLGRALKEEKASFKISEVLPMTDPRVTKAWTPDFPGVSNVDNCRDWNTGMPMDTKAIRDKDEKYWDEFKGTPKAFITLEDGQRLWGNRFGKLTAVRFADSGQDEAALKAQLVAALQPADISLQARDFKSAASAAAKGSVDFGGLFVGLSIFLIAAALVFAALLFVFMIERRATQTGLLMAVGWSPSLVRRSMLVEAGVIALLGSVLGLGGGVLYTKAALAALGGAWGGATAGLQLIYAAKPSTLIIAGASSLIVSLLTLWWASRRLFKTAPRVLLAGEGMSGHSATKKARWWRSSTLWAVLGLIGAAGLGFAGTKATNAEEIGGMFFGAGMMLMIAILALASGWMKRLSSSQQTAHSLAQIGLRNVVRRPGRSLAVLGMMAGGIFLVAAVNAFRLGAEKDATRRDSGTGGFALIGESSIPVYEDLNAKAGRDAFSLDDDEMKGIKVVPFRVRDGDDASCLNLNKAQIPQVVGVNPEALLKREAFAFAGGGSWDLLNGDAGEVPGIADQATAMWGLGKGVGDVIEYDLGGGKTLRVKLAALLAGSVLQGKVVISEAAFLKWMPDAAGYRFFLVDAPADEVTDARKLLVEQLEQRGLALEPTADRLAAFSAVQNTYISIFTVLGGLGVLLGTAGIGILVARHVLERQGELGLMQALGFLPAALRRMVIGEHAALLIAGVVCGALSAALAVWPSLQQASHDLPLGFLTKLLGAILLCGLLVCTIAATLAMRGRLTEAIRKE